MIHAAAWLAEQLLALWTAIVDAWVAWRGGEQDDGIEIELSGEQLRAVINAAYRQAEAEVNAERKGLN